MALNQGFEKKYNNLEGKQRISTVFYEKKVNSVQKLFAYTETSP